MCVAASLAEDNAALAPVRTAWQVLDRKRHGWLTLRGFRAQLKRQNCDAALSQSVLRAFAHVDQDKAGRIDWLEWMAACVMSNPSKLCSAEAVNDAFDRLDADSSGEISVDNLVSVLGAAHSQSQLQKLHAEVATAASSGDEGADGASMTFDVFASMLLAGDDDGYASSDSEGGWEGVLQKAKVIRGRRQASRSSAASPPAAPGPVVQRGKLRS